MSDDENVPELTEEDFARAKPFAEVFPRHNRAWRRRGRSAVAQPKVHVGFRFAADVVHGIKATGRGYGARVEKVLRAALVKGGLQPIGPVSTNADFKTAVAPIRGLRQPSVRTTVPGVIASLGEAGERGGREVGHDRKPDPAGAVAADLHGTGQDRLLAGALPAAAPPFPHSTDIGLVQLHRA